MEVSELDGLSVSDKPLLEASYLYSSVPNLEVPLRRARQDVDTTSVLAGLITGSGFPSDDGEFVGGVLIP